MTPEVSQFPSIKTDISDFCQEFAKILAPLEEVLRTGRERIQGKTDSDVLQRPLAGLSDAHHRLETLISKVEEQQAYVIIFGPLKSGKSTLMNAISATYVSEVTSLPAYPCLVHVKHGESYKFVASRYNGEKLSYADNRSLQMLIQDSHTTLADRLRQADENGEEFDPGVHYPQAIRRIDVEVPAKNLQDSLTVLVDTPGLYSRMKFGYDLMTREFRNSAACAVFVVKTDTLFLEQVFEEFGDLLDLFSRIFLVVNVDSNKRDLEPDGSFKPSLESESPHEVIKAFESLVMSAPLRKAAEEGRLRIYPIDLLNAASASLIRTSADASELSSEKEAPAGDEPAGDASEAVAEDEVKGGESEGDVAPEKETAGKEEEDRAVRDSGEHPVHSFSVFLNDLTEYLNSNDYLHEFMGDSLHLGKRLAGEIQSYCSAESTGEFRERQAVLRRELKETESRLAAVKKLESLDWQETFKRLREQNEEGAKTFSEEVRREAEEKALQALEAWFQSNQSLAALQREWADILDAGRTRVEKDCADRAVALVSDSFGGIELSPEVRRAIEGLDRILEPAVETARSTLQQTQPKMEDCQVEIQLEELKVRKNFLDWIFFRSLTSVRRRIFGESGKMDSPVASQVKQKRLGEEGKKALQDIATRSSSLFPREAARISEELLDNYVKTLGSEIRGRLESGKSEYARKKDGLERRLHDNAKIQEILDRLASDSVQVVDSILTLREKYQAKSWDKAEQGSAELAREQDSAEEGSAEEEAPPPLFPSVEANDEANDEKIDPDQG